MRIKQINGNQYLYTPQGRWVRNFASHTTNYLDLNNTIQPADHFEFLQNEVQNGLARYQWIDSEKFSHAKIAIISDGYDFQNKQHLLAKLPRDVALIGVNGALAKWSLPNRSLNYYVVNNPYSECMRYLPRKQKTLPRCIASARTNAEFLANYRGTKYRYYPVNESGYSTLGSQEAQWQIDDYRNPICAAIGLAHRFNVEKLLLFCCDDAFKDERSGAEQLHNGLWMYPQQEVAHGLIDGNLYWLRERPYQEIEIGDHSSGPIYENATYIAEDKLALFFGIENNEQTRE